MARWVYPLTNLLPITFNLTVGGTNFPNNNWNLHQEFGTCSFFSVVLRLSAMNILPKVFRLLPKIFLNIWKCKIMLNYVAKFKITLIDFAPINML